MPKISQVPGVGQVGIGGQQKPAIRVQVDPQALANRGISLEDVRNVLGQANVDLPKGTLNSPRQTYHPQHQRPADQARRLRRSDRRLSQRRAGAHPRHRPGHRRPGERPARRLVQQAARHHPGRPAPARRQRDRHGRSHQGAAAAAAGVDAAGHQARCHLRPHPDHPRLCGRRAVHAAADGRAGGDGDLHLPAQLLGDRHPGGHRAAVADRHLRGAL